jgi:predicted Fe-Mo cluster-binding NifX family protein
MRIKIAVPTKGSKGLDDVVSEIFAKAKTFTIIEIEDEQIKNV